MSTTLSTVTYLNLAAACQQLEVSSSIVSQHPTIAWLGSNGYLNLTKPELSALYDQSNPSPILSYTLLDFSINQPLTNGLDAVAFESPTGDIIFSFRGTDDVEDWTTDSDMLTGDNLDTNYQFASAYTFVTSVLTNVTNRTNNPLINPNVSFTGHSLGGSLAQYVVYKLEQENGTSSTAYGDVPAVNTISAVNEFFKKVYCNLITTSV